MTNLYRLVLAALLLAVGCGASAALPKVQQWRAYWGTQTLGLHSSVGGACGQMVSYGNSLPIAEYGWQITLTGTNASGTCFVTLLQRKPADWDPAVPWEPSPNPAEMYATLEGAGCPANSTDNGTDCTCSAGFEEKDGQCKPVNPCPAGQHEEGGACVPDSCNPDEKRINGVCVKEPECPPGQTRVNGVCKENGCRPPGKDMGTYDTAGEAVSYYCEPYNGKNCTVKVLPSVCVTYDGMKECSGTGRLTGAECTDRGEGGPSTGGQPGDNNPGNNNNGGNNNPGGNGGDGGENNGGNGGNGGGNNNGGNPNGGDNNGGNGGNNNGGNGGDGGNNNNNGGSNNNGNNNGGNSSSGLPTPKPEQPGPDGACPPGTTKQGTVCVKDPVPPDGDGNCPEGSVKVGTTCVFTYPVGGGNNGNGSGGDGDGDGDESGWSGTCKAGFSCEGDAIQCAIAKEQHRINCELFGTENLDKDYKSAVDGSDPKGADKLRETATPVSVGSLDSAGLGWSRSCPPDPSFEIVGKTFDIPFSKVCGPLSVLSMAAVGLTLLSCLLWVVGKVD